jgi:hypothetical protein
MPEHCKSAGEAARAFVVVFKDSPDPQAALRSFLQKLQANPKWTPDEVDEVRRLILEQMPGCGGQ